MRLVLRIGGSVIASPINSVLIDEYVSLLRDLRKQGHELAVVVGGGNIAREFIRAARDMGLDERTQDEAAISISRIFAKLFLRKLGEWGCDALPLTIEDATKCLRAGRIVVMGGLKPGMTTDTVAALIVKQMNAELLIKATNQEGVYDKDPEVYKDAIKLEEVDFNDLPNILTGQKHKAGIHQILDPRAVGILREERTKVVVVNGFETENIMSAARGEKVGTLIK